MVIVGYKLKIIVISIIILMFYSSSLTRSINGENYNFSFSNLNLNNTESYLQDFSNWVNITRTGDQPSFWQINSDPAQYLSGGPGTYGSYLNMLSPGVSLNGYDFNIEWKAKFTTTNYSTIRRFLRLYCYWTDSTFFHSTLNVWDGVPTIELSAGVGTSEGFTWLSNTWRNITIEARILGSNLYFEFLLDGKSTGITDKITNRENYFLDYCSFYIYQNQLYTGDSIYVDDFKIYEIPSNNTKVTETVTITDTTTETSTEKTTDTIIETGTEKTTDTTIETITNTINETFV